MRKSYIAREILIRLEFQAVDESIDLRVWTSSGQTCIERILLLFPFTVLAIVWLEQREFLARIRHYPDIKANHSIPAAAPVVSSLASAFSAFKSGAIALVCRSIQSRHF